MKNIIITAALLLIYSFANAQISAKDITSYCAEISLNPKITSDGFVSLTEVKSTYDTIILSRGKGDCLHSWVQKQAAQRHPFGAVCAVAHGPEGCSDGWMNTYRICRNCLQHEHIRETRKVVEKKDEYTELLNKLCDERD